MQSPWSHETGIGEMGECPFSFLIILVQLSTPQQARVGTRRADRPRQQPVSRGIIPCPSGRFLHRLSFCSFLPIVQWLQKIQVRSDYLFYQCWETKKQQYPFLGLNCCCSQSSLSLLIFVSSTVL